MENLDCVVVGAGVVGLAVAASMAKAGRDVLILEAEDAFGTHTSARNSEVIHAGISYAPGSLKAKLCLQGRDMLYTYAAERGIGHRRLGKLIVAVEESELTGLQTYLDLAKANGVFDLQALDVAEIHALEPEVRAVAGLYSPSTGIIDSHALMLSYLGDAEQAGATLVLQSPVLGGQTSDEGIILDVGGVQPLRIRAKTVINCAGLWAHALAQKIQGMPTEHVPNIHYAIGHYYTFKGKSPFTHLVYPVARQAAQRVHVTLDLGGQCKFGPDISWRDTVDYQFDHRLVEQFEAGVRRFWPGLPDAALQPGYTGIRPRLAGPESLQNAGTDFLIQGSETHGVHGLFNLFGIESPGLTASLALGQHIARLAA